MYVVTGVSGYVGGAVAERLLERVPADQVIVTSRDEASLETWRARGVDVRVADFADRASLEAAFRGGERLLMISTMEVGPRRQQQHRNAVEAAQAAGVRHLVYTSFIGTEKPEVDSVEVTDHKFTEALVTASGLTWNFLRNNQYADAMAENQAAIAITSGRSIGNTADGLVGFVSRDDVAGVAASLLLGDGEPDTGYDVTGPELLTYRQVGEMISELSGAPIEIVDLTDDEMYAMWDALGVPREATGDFSASPVPWCSDGMVTFGRMIRAGHLAKLTDVVERFTGRPPRSLRDLMLERRHTWPPVPQEA
ncbi:SDR family oxidoreductase [Agromyces aerolatus]|uniref:SDR family oxidoreductase n=1 Tax=Agromyces sp. LY-1074 TaxID=3074080 RepID=UPI002858C9A0|nr:MULTISPECIES: SDR family oxidoreductase [unclassified Agromyces]MDR5698705.1 SDR family oxidoreductase [Agromyces sp. LY-1074]MDR5704999.1 SDR family oxidoreductase [Agromyces sp. LY-1358]